MGNLEKDDRRRQSNRDKRIAKRKRVQADREELARFRSARARPKGQAVNPRAKAKVRDEINQVRRSVFPGPKIAVHALG